MTPIAGYNKETGEWINASAEKTTKPLDPEKLGETKLIGGIDGGMVSLELGNEDATIDFGEKGSIVLGAHTRGTLRLHGHQVVTIEPYTITTTATPEIPKKK